MSASTGKAAPFAAGAALTAVVAVAAPLIAPLLSSPSSSPSLPADGGVKTALVTGSDLSLSTADFGAETTDPTGDAAALALDPSWTSAGPTSTLTALAPSLAAATGMSTPSSGLTGATATGTATSGTPEGSTSPSLALSSPTLSSGLLVNSSTAGAASSTSTGTASTTGGASLTGGALDPGSGGGDGALVPAAGDIITGEVPGTADSAPLTAAQATAVPEPTSLALFGAGALGLVFARLRRRCRAAGPGAWSRE